MFSNNKDSLINKQYHINPTCQLILPFLQVLNMPENRYKKKKKECLSYKFVERNCHIIIYFVQIILRVTFQQMSNFSAMLIRIKVIAH